MDELSVNEMNFLFSIILVTKTSKMIKDKISDAQSSEDTTSWWIKKVSHKPEKLIMCPLC